jgi:hypothetical protein
MASNPTIPAPVQDLSERFFDENIRIDEIIWLDANSSSQCDAFDDFIEGEDAETIASLFDTTPQKINAIIKLGGDTSEEFACWLARNRKSGFLVKAATPIPHDIRKGSHSFSWGYVQCGWFHTHAFDVAFFERLNAWKMKIIVRESKKEAAEKKKAAKADPKI